METRISPWKQAKKILAIRLDRLGDVAMTEPALRTLAQADRARRLTLLTSSAGVALAPLMPFLEHAIVYDAPWMKGTAVKKSPDEDWVMIQRLGRERFDAAVIFTVCTQSPMPAALMAYLAGIPLRLSHARENPYQLLTHWVPEIDLSFQKGVRHEVRRQLDLVASVGCFPDKEKICLSVPPLVSQNVETILKELGLRQERPWVVIHPGASAPSRRYSWEGFANVSQRLTQEYGFQVVFTGSPDEIGTVQKIRLAMEAPSYTLVGNLDIPHLTGLLKKAPLLIANNTGPVHLAAGVGTPVVDLYALTNPQHTPWGVPSRVLFREVPCRHCLKSVCPEGHHACLSFEPKEVLEAALELWLENEKVETKKFEAVP